MVENDRNINTGNSAPSKNKGRSHDFLSALEMHGNGNKSAISKELRKLALLMRNVKKNEKDDSQQDTADGRAANVVSETTVSGKTDFSKIDEFIMAEGEATDMTIDDIIRSGAPSGDYFSENDFVEGDASDGGSSQIDSIDSFLAAVKNGELKNACSIPDGEEILESDDCDMCDDETGGIDESFFTESLAKIYIKQRRYDKALEIINKLSLIYPEKNIYFADQIRFLKKLIDNIKTE